MTTSASRPINSTETTFSYAAAASGKNSAGSTLNKSQTNSSSKPSISSSTGPPPTQRPVSSASSSTAPNMNGSTAPTTGTSTPQSLPTVVPGSHLESNGGVGSTTISSSVSSPSTGPVLSSALPKEDDSISSVPSEDKTASWEKQSQTSSRDDKKTSSAGSRTPDVPKDVTLVPAPPPSVNPWNRSSPAKKSNAPTTVPSAPAAAKTPASLNNAIAAKDNVDKLAELKQVEKKKKPIGENLDVLEKEKSKEGPSGVGKDGLAREPGGRKKSADAGRVNGYAGKDDASIPRKSTRKVYQQEKEPAAPVLPPPVTDVESWPTPEIAQDEVEKAKREKDEKDKTASSEVRSNLKWVPVSIPPPYVPLFSSKTGRASRGRGGARDGGRGGGVGTGAIPSSSPNGEKHAGGAFGSGSGSGTGVENDRGRQGSGAGPSRGGHPGNKNGKRATSAGGTTQRRESKGSLPIPQEKRKEPTAPEAGETAPESVQSAKTSSTGTQTQTERSHRGSKADESTFVAQGDGRQFPENQDRGHQNGNGHNYHPRSERGSYQAFNGNRSDHHGVSDNGSTHAPRERSYESGRGRGGYRGRYNSQFANGHNTNHHQNQGHYTSTPSHFNSHSSSGQYQPQGSQSSQRVFRGSRSHPSHNNQNYNRFPNPNMQPPPAFMPPYPVPFEPYMMAPNGMPVHVELPGMLDIITQINYYFSVDNLCKDMFLRKHMDSDGYVRLSIVAGFNLLKKLTQDLNVLQQACLQSQEVHLATGVDDLYIRKAVGWETWILNESDRDPAARCGMSSWHIDHRHRVQQNSISSSPLEMSGSAVPFMPDAGRGRTQSGIAPGAPAFVPSGFYPVDVGSSSTAGVTSLSANVPEFSPSTTPLVNGSMEDHFPIDEFPDIDIGRLVIVCKRSGGGESNNTSPLASPTKSRSNGIVDGVNGVFTNGTTSGPSSPNKSSFGHRSSEIGWLLGGDSGSREPSREYVHKLYQVVLTQSREQREASGPSKTGEIATLYKFWPHFLLDKFNGQIYAEFKACALADADLFVRFGLEHLFKFYEDLLKERDEVHGSLIQDFITLVKKDARNGRESGLEKLVSILESSRLSAQNKQKIEALLDSEIHEVLENGVEKKDGQLIESYAA